MAKDGNGFWRKASVLITIIVVTVSAAIAYGFLCKTVNSNEDDIKEIKPIVHENKGDIREMNVKIDSIKDTVEKNYTTQQEILRELRGR